MLKTSVLCFTLHLLEKVGATDPPPRLRHPCVQGYPKEKVKRLIDHGTKVVFSIMKFVLISVTNTQSNLDFDTKFAEIR